MFIHPKRATHTILVCSVITITALLLSLTQWRALSAGANAPMPDAISRVIESAYAAPIAQLPGLVSVTIWEDTRILLTDPLNEVTLPIADNRLSTRLATLDGSNHDFAIFRGGGDFDEYYDFFFSNADGTPNPEGEFLTTEVRHSSSNGGNISEVTLNFLDGRRVNANAVASFVVLGPGDADTVLHAVDGDLNTTTLLGNSPDQRLRLTVGFPPIAVGSCTSPQFGAATSFATGHIPLLSR